MTALDWLLWGASVWAAFFLFVLLDVPILLGRAVNRLRQQHTPHWARYGHAPPLDDTTPEHDRHARKDPQR